ncbi:hypothetical protein LNA02_10790 [Levilactobacillus namurensis]|nr:hypothetical protein LNA02_10790 [Levilactobacillus namurensis]
MPGLGPAFFMNVISVFKKKIDQRYKYLVEDIIKNYLFDLYPDFPKNFDLANRKDPDNYEEAKPLYDDLCTAFFNTASIAKLGLKTVISEPYHKQPILSVDGGRDLILSSDYIGPSVYWAQKVGMPDETIIEFLKVSRTLGGHIVFPAYRSITMNQARSGKNGYYDRFDKTLYAMKQLFNGDEISNQWVQKAWENYTNWFDLFRREGHPFETFVHFFKLESFVNDAYEVYDLTTFDDHGSYTDTVTDDQAEIPEEAAGYARYVRGSLHAIALRNQELGLS